MIYIFVSDFSGVFGTSISASFLSNLPTDWEKFTCYRIIGSQRRHAAFKDFCVPSPSRGKVLTGTNVDWCWRYFVIDFGLLIVVECIGYAHAVDLPKLSVRFNST